MTRTLVQIRKQIESLEKEAENIREKEVAGVITRIKEAIAFYSLSSADLFGSRQKKPAIAKSGVSKTAKKPKTRKAPVARFRDASTGKTWTGHGKRPGWFVDAIASGKTADDLAIKPLP